jgi:alkanesulfonate monooxygenase SsuD/methylene tetrahydromethanopterin reductase-like flavin-dependent oxidoreductase (luciferase family)
VQHALYVPPFGELSDPAALIELAVTAERAGWDGLFLWDHVHRDPAEVRDIADAWTLVAAAAMRTERIRVGPMVTPASRRRVGTLIRQGITVDHLSSGRLVVGLGLGVDTGGELSRFGEVVDPVTRGEILDEAADVLAQAWSGEHVEHHGRHLTVDGVTFRPRPVQRPSIPLWFAARGSALKPVRRAAGYDGLFVIDAVPSEVERAIAEVARLRGSSDGFDVAVSVSPDDDPALVDVPGVTWAMHSFEPVVPLDEITAIAVGGPPA